MKTLSKLKGVNKGIIYDIFFRSYLGISLALYFKSIIQMPFKIQAAYFVILAIISVIGERIKVLGFGASKVSIENNVLTIFKSKYTKSDVEYIKYAITDKFTHTIRIKLKGYLPQDFSFNSPNFTEDLRLFKFIKENFLPVTMVEELPAQ